MQQRDDRGLARHRRQGVEKVLGELEAQVMGIVWARGGRARVRDVLTALNAGRSRPAAYTTVMTVMARLSEKGVLQRELVGQTYEYTPALSPEALLEQASEQIAARMIEDFGGGVAVAGFLSALQRVAPERLRDLRELAGEEQAT